MTTFLGGQTIDVSETVASKIASTIKELIKVDCQGFIGPQPISIERKHLSNLKNDYYASYKADGTRYCFCAFVYEGKNICAFLDRKMQVYPLKVHIPREFFKGTFIDGEIIKHNDNYYFLGFDCIMVSGKNVVDLPFSERMAHIDVVMNSINKNEYCIFQTKKFTKLNEFDKFYKSHEFASDGYIFMPNKDPIKTGTHNSFYKLKDGLENTIDFLIDEKHKLCLIKNNTITKTMNKIDYSVIAKDKIVPNSIYESKYVAEKTWAPLHKREDKDAPNSYYVYQRTLVNIKENINISEIFSLFQN